MVTFSEAVLWDHFSTPGRLGGGKITFSGERSRAGWQPLFQWKVAMRLVGGDHRGVVTRSGHVGGGDSEVGGGGREGAEILGPKCQVSEKRVWKIDVKSY